MEELLEIKLEDSLWQGIMVETRDKAAAAGTGWLATGSIVSLLAPVFALKLVLLFQGATEPVLGQQSVLVVGP